MYFTEIFLCYSTPRRMHSHGFNKNSRSCIEKSSLHNIFTLIQKTRSLCNKVVRLSAVKRTKKQISHLCRRWKIALFENIASKKRLLNISMDIKWKENSISFQTRTATCKTWRDVKIGWKHLLRKYITEEVWIATTAKKFKFL